MGRSRLRSERDGRRRGEPWPRHQLPVHSPITRDALGAGWKATIGGGDPRDELRSSLAASYAARRVELYDSGTSALTAAIGMASAPFGNEAVVALPAYGCYDLATAAVGARRPVVLYDVDPLTLGPDPSSLREALRLGANVVVCAALYGVPIDWEMVEELTTAAGAVVIEDAAQGQGGSWRGRPLGSLGDSSVLSFGRGKGWTGGRGGALLQRTEGEPKEGGGLDFGGQAREATSSSSNLRAILPAVLQWLFGRPWLYWIPSSLPWLGLGETRYRDPGRAGGLAAASAALLLASRGEALAEGVVRRANAEFLLSHLPPRGRIHPIEVVDGSVPGCLRLPLRAPGVGARLARTPRARRLGIAPGYPTPLSALEPLINRLVGRNSPWPGAEELVRDLITLPTHRLLTRRDLERLIDFLGDGAPSLTDPHIMEPISR